MTRDASPHISDDGLAGAALGDPLTRSQQAHVDSCPRCRLEVSRLLEVVAISHDDDAPTVDIADPPGRVWSAIQAEVNNPTVVPLAASSRTAARSGSRRGRYTGPFLLAAVVVGVLVGGGLMAGAEAWRAEPTVVAAAPLTPVPGGPAGPQTGLAQIEKAADGEVLAVSTSDLSDPTGYYEVWLLDPVSGGMIAMGVVPGGTGSATLPVPAGVDLSQYIAVDISDEPMDGDPGHSSVSVLRGQLAT